MLHLADFCLPQAVLFCLCNGDIRASREVTCLCVLLSSECRLDEWELPKMELLPRCFSESLKLSCSRLLLLVRFNLPWFLFTCMFDLLFISVLCWLKAWSSVPRVSSRSCDRWRVYSSQSLPQTDVPACSSSHQVVKVILTFTGPWNSF